MLRAALPLLIYGDAGSHEQAALREHLAHCPACRREQQTLENVRRLLDDAAIPDVAVDLSQLYRTHAARQARRLRRWRRGAVVVGAVAAVLLLVLGLRLEVRMGTGQMVVYWGDPPSATPVPAPPKVIVMKAELPPETEAELRVLRELIHALKQDADDRDQRFGERLDRLQRYVQVLQAQGEQRWSTTEHDVAALYLLTRKGEKP